MSTMKYRDYVAAIQYDGDLGTFMGTVLNIASPVTFYGKNTAELHSEFARSIDAWLKICEERNIERDSTNLIQSSNQVSAAS